MTNIEKYLNKVVDYVMKHPPNLNTYLQFKKENLFVTSFKDYCKHTFGFLSPKVTTGDSVFSNISPVNPEPGRGLEAGIQFIMLNYQKIDTNMSNYAYIFKDSSFVEKAETAEATAEEAAVEEAAKDSKSE